MPRARGNGGSSFTVTVAKERTKAPKKKEPGASSRAANTSTTSNSKGKKRDEPSTSRAQFPRTSKRPRKQTQQKEAPEKRLARFISQPNVGVFERIQRAFHHRLYLIDKKLVGDPDSPSACEFFVLGATGNVYSVRLDHRPSCTCPDFLRGNTCKHILFVMLRVLKLPRDDPRVWQKALLSSELEQLLHISCINEAVLASQQVRTRFQEIKSLAPGKQEEEETVQRDLDGDCPVCYEPMAEGKEYVEFCKVCGNNVHRECFMKWSKSKGSGNVTCIYCRAPWENSNKNKNQAKGEGYVNLAAYSGTHRPEDTTLEILYPETSIWIRRRS